MSGKDCQMVKAKRLVHGDTIGIVSPSWGGAGAFPHRVDLAVKQLNTFGFKVKFGHHALNQRGCVSDTAENRAQDLHDLFADSEVMAIMAAIGGDHSCQVLPLLDFNLIQQHPKIFIGYSDITVLNLAIWKRTGLVTFNGPTLIADVAEFPNMFEYSAQHMMKAVCENAPIGRIEPSPWWTEEFLDWSRKQDLERPRARIASDGWVWLRDGYCEGTLVGGCLESLQHLRGTPYWPDWDDAILFFETSEEKPSPDKVDGILMDYENMGVFEKLRGMLVGRPMRYSDSEKQALHQIILERTRRYSFPIVANMDFGHTAPQITLPIGIRARIDTSQRAFEIIDAAVV